MVFHKSSYETLKCSLMDMRKYMENMGIHKVAMPLIGCGIDGLRWSKVKATIKDVFIDSDVEILVCYFKKDEYLLKR